MSITEISPLNFSTVEYMRRNKGLSQGELADLIGMSRNSIVHVERGVVHPGPRLRSRLSEAFGVSEKALFPDDVPGHHRNSGKTAAK